MPDDVSLGCTQWIEGTGAGGIGVEGDQCSFIAMADDCPIVADLSTCFFSLLPLLPPLFFPFPPHTKSNDLGVWTDLQPA